MSWAWNGLGLAPLLTRILRFSTSSQQMSVLQGTPARGCAGHALHGVNGSQSEGWAAV
jgi:hypothetical protein